MSTPSLPDFQQQVSELLLRHRSLLDVLSKFQQSNASVNRSVVKAVTECGCIELNAKKQHVRPDMSAEDVRKMADAHVSGQLCEQCLEAISAEVGKNMFYMAALGNVLKIDLESVMRNESDKCATLGFFNLS